MSAGLTFRDFWQSRISRTLIPNMVLSCRVLAAFWKIVVSSHNHPLKGKLPFSRHSCKVIFYEGLASGVESGKSDWLVLAKS